MLSVAVSVSASASVSASVSVFVSVSVSVFVSVSAQQTTSMASGSLPALATTLARSVSCPTCSSTITLGSVRL
jgi:hypothetical protein